MLEKVSDYSTADDFNIYFNTIGKISSKNFKKCYHNEIPSLELILNLEDCIALQIFNIFAGLKEKKVQIF